MVCGNFYGLDTRARVCGGWSVLCRVSGRVVLGQLFNIYGTSLRGKLGVGSSRDGPTLLIERPTEPENLGAVSKLFLV